jgi:dTDP-4-amino-4,6-dideoxygalactose transaminase
MSFPPVTESARSGKVTLSWMDHREPKVFAEIMQAVERVASRGAFILGQEVLDFEAAFAVYCETEHAIGVSSGTEAIVLVLRALGIGAGDEVVVPANTFFATAEAVSLVGASPRFADVDPETALVTADSVEAALTDRTRAIIPVHLYGRVVDMDPILELAGRRGLPVIEDSAQAHGARYHGRRIGSMGVAASFSFYPAKNLGAWGDAGAVVTNDAALDDQVRLLRAHGERPRYHHNVVGTTARLDAIQAAVLATKLPLLDAVNERRRAVAAELSEALADSGVQLPPETPEGVEEVFHQYVIRLDDRDGLREHLERRGIESGVHYPVPLHLVPAYADLGYEPGSLPAAEELSRRSCSLPAHSGMTPQDIARVADAVREFAAADGE